MDGAQSRTARPNVKMDAGVDAANMCAKFPMLVVSHDIVLRAHQAVLKSIPQLVWLGQSIPHRYDQLSYFEAGDAIVAAASSAISAGKGTPALEWLEEGRIIVWVQLQCLRSPLDDLRAQHPELATELEQISTSLHGATQQTTTTLEVAESESSDSPIQPPHTLEGEARRARQLA
jgi:hypothetical protein